MIRVIFKTVYTAIASIILFLVIIFAGVLHKNKQRRIKNRRGRNI